MFVAAIPYESEIARRWWAISPGSLLPLSNGGSVQIVFAGYPGGSAGPDVHDAVLCLPGFLCPVADGELQSALPEKYVGDVEFHIRTSDWEAHHHHTDPRYNRVILHVVLVCDRASPTIRQDGQVVPVCSLQDLPLAGLQVPFQLPLKSGHVWSCHRVRQCLSAVEYDKLLVQAGLLRFEQKVDTFVEQLHSAASIEEHCLYDTCLIPALAEGLGYGRDREFFRAVGLRLVGKTQHLPEPLGRVLEPSPLDVARLRVLSRLVAQWRTPGVWETLLTDAINQVPTIHAINCEADAINRVPTPSPDKSGKMDMSAPLQAIRDAFCMLGLSLARTDILICNVVLPFAAAIALLEHDMLLYERAQAIYVQHPGLASNRITRMMCAQLRLPEEPRGSCQQQGLHYIYQQTCREKRCEVCLIGRKA